MYFSVILRWFSSSIEVSQGFFSEELGFIHVAPKHHTPVSGFLFHSEHRSELTSISVLVI